ncbi:MAG: DUF6249 domain-containing protein [Myxococcota bacterium]
MKATVWTWPTLLGLSFALVTSSAYAEPPSVEISVQAGVGEDAEEETESDETRAAKVLAKVLGDKLPDVAERIATAMESKAKKEEAAFARLTDQQVYEIMKAREGSEPPPLVALVAPIGFFIMVLGIVAIVFFFRGRSEERRHETIRLAVERGMEIPSELLLPKGARRSDLRRGLVLGFGGLGLAVAMSGSDSDGSWAVAIFPMMIGVGYLAFWWLDRLGWDGSGRGLKY